MFPLMQDLEKDPVLNATERRQVNAALEAVLATDKFEAAPQMSAFLRYVVEQAASGNQSRIKAFTVAVDALGKPDNFDPQNDPVVRVLAGRLRASLSAYNDENPDAELIITMTPGSYVPSFLTQQSIRDKAAIEKEARRVVEHVRSPDVVDIDLSDANEIPAQNRTLEETVSEAVNSTSYTAQASGQTASSSGTNDRVHNSPGNSQQPAGLINKLSHWISRVPKQALIVALIAVAAIAFVQNNRKTNAEPDIQAATEAGAAATAMGSARSRPDAPSVLISAVDQGNALENNLNALVSGVISESEEVKVYRILDKQSGTVYWPEDYILTLTALDMPDETRVNMQLMEAMSGRIVHSEAVGLNELAIEQLTQQELGKLIDAARLIVSSSGPLLEDYASKVVIK